MPKRSQGVCKIARIPTLITGAASSALSTVGCGEDLENRNITIAERRTSIRLEPVFWEALNEIALREQRTIHAVVTAVAARKGPDVSLTSAVRTFVAAYYSHLGNVGPTPESTPPAHIAAALVPDAVAVTSRI